MKFEVIVEDQGVTLTFKCGTQKPPKARVEEIIKRETPGWQKLVEQEKRGNELGRECKAGDVYIAMFIGKKSKVKPEEFAALVAAWIQEVYSKFP